MTKAFAAVGMISVLILHFISTSLAAQPMVIDWKNCHSPDLSSTNHLKTVQSLADGFVKLASQSEFPHIAVGLNKLYGNAVQQRRDFVRLNYIPIGSNRSLNECSLSEKNYARLLAYRDASYYILCRAEVGIGASRLERSAKELKTLTYSKLYDLIKQRVDMRAKPDEPTTPAGGYDSCQKGAHDGLQDPFPSDEAIRSFGTRLLISESEKNIFQDALNR